MTELAAYAVVGGLFCYVSSKLVGSSKMAIVIMALSWLCFLIAIIDQTIAYW